MKIDLNQTYNMNNFISRSGRFTTSEFQQAVSNLLNNYKEYAINKGDYLITTTKSIEIINNEQILDVEILLPVLEHISVLEPYIYKEHIHITNALYTIVSDLTKLTDTINEVNQYISENRLQAITHPYLVQTKQNNDIQIEIYIGLNPNII